MTNFLHHVKGRWKSFYVPSFRPDFELAVDVLSLHNYILCKQGRVQIAENLLVGKSICIFFKDGTYIAKEISGTVSDINLQLFTSGAIGKTFTIAEVNMICLLDLMRLASDSVTVKYTDIDDVSCKLNLISVFDDEEQL